VWFLREALASDNGWKVPLNRVTFLSDFAQKDPRSPMKSAIEQTLMRFVQSSRAQDRVVVFFIGRGVEIGGKAYLVPIEGELDNVATLLPLQWVYEQLQACKAREKLLVLDISRFSPTQGVERPEGGPLSAKFEAALKNPPAGVQVWSACSAGQRSYETDDPVGVFLEAVMRSARKGIQNKIQKPDDSLPVEYFKEAVNEMIAQDLRPRKLEQVCFLAGRAPEDGAPFDPSEPPPLEVVLPGVATDKTSERIVKAVLAQVGTPAVKPSMQNEELRYDALPPFIPAKLKGYEDGDGKESTPLRQAVRKARAALWAIAGGGEPPELRADVTNEKRGLKGINLSVLREDGFRAPPPVPNQETAFKNRIMENERQVARMMGRLNEALEELKAAGEMREAEPKRWQANYDFITARVEAQIAFLYEYQSMLGQMRKEFPPRDPKLHGGWRLAARASLQGDRDGQKLAKSSLKLLEKIAREHAGTPWEVLAKREKLTTLGLEWQPTR
jgi:hypothetical protein